MTWRAALIHDVFFDASGARRLAAALDEARSRGAALAVLPELALNAWAPAGRTQRDEDAEPPGGPRAEMLSSAARSAGIALLGGAIVRDRGRRFNRALLFDAAGEPRAAYDKCHLPSEDGYWESDHYEPGTEPPRPVPGFPLALGIQICSDVQRPEGSRLLAFSGVEVLAVPRATPAETWERWRLVLRANALTCAAYVLSANRPGPEPGVAVGGPSFAAGPDGEVLCESTERVSVVPMEREAVVRARGDYPGYLPTRADLWARGWASP